MKFTNAAHTEIEKNTDGTYTVYRAGYYKDLFPLNPRNTYIWGVKKEDGTVLINPDYITEDEERTVRFTLMNDGYETYENIASIPNWWVVRERA